MTVPGSPASAPAIAADRAYAIATASGSVATFGGAGFAGDRATDPPASPVVGMAATPDGRGYVLAERDGAVLAFGDARHPAAAIGGPATVSVAEDPADGGWYTVTSTGLLRSPGDRAGVPVALPEGSGAVVGVAVAGIRGAGAWVATSSGVVVAEGETPPAPPRDGRPTAGGPVVGIAATPDGRGYWLVTSGGATVPAGDAPTLTPDPAGPGSVEPGAPAPVTAIVPTPDGAGALLVRSDGSVTTLGDAVYSGDASSPLHPPLYPTPYELPATGAVGGAYLALGPQPARRGPLRVAFLGDSLSVILGRGTRQYLASRSDDAWVAIGGILGCGVVGDLPLAVYSHDYPLGPTLPACAHWRQQYLRTLALDHPDVVVLLLGYWESQRHSLPHLGSVTAAGSAAYRTYLRAQLQAAGQLIARSGARLVVATAPYDGDGTPAANVDAVNALLRSSFGAATMFDLATLLAPDGRYASTVDGIRVRSTDRVHLTDAGVEQVIDPALVPVTLAAARAGRHQAG